LTDCLTGGLYSSPGGDVFCIDDRFTRVCHLPNEPFV
jgi:hypothetical protein